MEMSAGVWIHLHIPELKSPLAPGFGQTEFLLGRSNKRLHLTLLTRTAPTCPVAAWDVRLGEKTRPLSSSAITRGTHTGCLTWVDKKVWGTVRGRVASVPLHLTRTPLRRSHFFWLNDDNMVGKHWSRGPPMLLNLRVMGFDRNYKTCSWPLTPNGSKSEFLI